ncbi:MAG TPA: hypothetical protein V6D25_28230 [Leptolyngbyaceae cyanobacterium]
MRGGGLRSPKIFAIAVFGISRLRTYNICDVGNGKNYLLITIFIVSY